ncbi:class II cAMP phosphodiesterase [Ephemerocybe angulata]|uniref:Class II cAMP phosphodiesterase n=1 Tax=Ephemerocybe angulata TaxID=980116 RepID=A0A8H6IGG9_9AGAR|nr:class II cAMP phosphodiesterase [Tulosesus angulatus]
MPKRQQDVQQGPPPFYKRFFSLCQRLLDHATVSANLVLNTHHQEPSPEANTVIIHERHQEPTTQPSPMTAFDIVVIGAGGGPDETNLSAYLVKSHPSRWEDGVLALEAGSGQGALRHIVERNPRLFSSETEPGRALSATEVYNAIRCFLITHAHLDHINSLVVSAGSLSGPRKRIYAAKQTLDDIASIFNDRIWPNLASWKEDDENYKLLYSPLQQNTKYTSITPDISVQSFPLNHGSNDQGPYESFAYFIRHDLSGGEFLFFGDVEPDSLAATPQSIHVWRTAAPKIPTTLRAIFIECSWSSGRPDNQLFGHLTPEHLLEELVVLATEVRKARPSNHSSETHTRHTRKRQKRLVESYDVRGALIGLTVYVMHCKDAPHDPKRAVPMREIIAEQVRALVEEKGLGCTILAAEQGMHIRI